MIIRGGENSIKGLLRKFFEARGDRKRRHELLAEMRKIRERFRILKTEFHKWFREILRSFSAEEHQTAWNRLMCVQAQVMTETRV